MYGNLDDVKKHFKKRTKKKGKKKSMITLRMVKKDG